MSDTFWIDEASSVPDRAWVERALIGIEAQVLTMTCPRARLLQERWQGREFTRDTSRLLLPLQCMKCGERHV